mgnify:CR=1 FL=1
MTELGHVVFYVRDLQRSLQFYRDVVGLEVQGRIFGDRAALLSGGRTHHELLLIQVGEAEADIVLLTAPDAAADINTAGILFLIGNYCIIVLKTQPQKNTENVAQLLISRKHQC